MSRHQNPLCVDNMNNFGTLDNKSDAEQSGLAFVLRMSLLVFISLWAIDVVVSLQSATRVLVGPALISTSRLYLGLLLAEIPLGIIVVAGAILTGYLAQRSFRQANLRQEILSVGCAMLIYLSVLSGCKSALRLAGSGFLFAAILVVPISVAAWHLIRKRAYSDRLEHPVPSLSFLHVSVFPIACGLGTLALASIFRLEISKAVVAGFWMVALLWAVRITEARFRGEALVSACVLPLAVSISLATLSVYQSVAWSRSRDIPEVSPRAPSPDVVLIVLDTVRADRLRCYGSDRDTMPSLERWAANSVRFRRAVSPAGWTTPAHASILSGLPVSLHGIHYASDVGFRTGPFEDIDWLPTMLRELGYYTLAVTANDLAIPEEAGFHRVLTPLREEWGAYTLGGLFESNVPVRSPVSSWTRWRLPYAPAREIADMVSRAAPVGKLPVFLLVNFLDAHSPYNPPGTALSDLGLRVPSRFPRDWTHREFTLKWSELAKGKETHLRDLYDGELKGLDTSLERLLDWIDLELGPDTLVIITSDHGEELGEEGRVGHEYGLSQSLIHVPLFIRGAGLDPQIVDPPVSLTSLFTLIFNAAKAETREVNELFSETEFGVLAERYVSHSDRDLFGSNNSRPWVAMIEGEVKGVGPSEFGFQMFDVEREGFSREILIDSGALSDALRIRIDGYWSRFRDQRREQIDPKEELQQRERLRALGYLD